MEARSTRRSSRSNAAATTASSPTECAQGFEQAGSVACENPAQSPTPLPLHAQHRSASNASLRQHVCVFCSCATIAVRPLTPACLMPALADRRRPTQTAWGAPRSYCTPVSGLLSCYAHVHNVPCWSSSRA